MTFKKFSTTQDTPVKHADADKPKDAAAKPVEVAPAPKK